GATTPEQFSGALYTHILQRQPTASELEFWSLGLQNGSSPGQIARSFIDSNEYRANLITQAYQHYLHRSPEAGAVNLWTAQMQGGLSYQTFLSEVLSSKEYIQDHGGGAGWITGIYQDLLGRTPDQSGLTAWTGLLNQGLPPSSIALRFMYSPENLTIQVTGVYHSSLGRNPDAAGLSNWVASMETGLSLEQLTTIFDSSSEFIGNAITVSPPTFGPGTPTNVGSGVTLVVPGFSSTSTPAIAIDVNPPNFSGQVSIDVDLNHNGSFTDPGETAQTTGTITPQNHQVTLHTLANGTFAIRVRVNGSSGDVISAPVNVTVNTNQGFIGSTTLLGLYDDFKQAVGSGSVPANFYKAHGELFDAQ